MGIPDFTHRRVVAREEERAYDADHEKGKEEGEEGTDDDGR